MNDSQNEDSTSKSHSTDPDSLENASEPAHTSDSNPVSSKDIPLPVFDPARTENESSLKALADTLPELEAILRNEMIEPPPPPKHVYQVSSAETDWSAYTPPLLEDDEQTEQQEETQSGWKTAWAVVREVGETIILTLIIFFLIQTVIRNFRVVGTSMIDNLHDGQYLIIDKLTYGDLFQTMGWGGPRHGDVVVFEPPNRPGEDYVKRIVGLPGETVEIKDGTIFVNNEPLQESFQPKTARYYVPETLIPAGHVYVLGDNRNNSNDSHNWGPLPVENIVGRAWISYWPPEYWGVIPHDAPTEQATLKRFLSELVPDASAGNE